MANTITNTTLLTGNMKVVKYITIASDGSEETDLVLYDSSAVATTLGLADTLNCRILRMQGIIASASTARAVLKFDATTDVLAYSIPAFSPGIETDYLNVGGLRNTAGTGKTGDITLTTTGLEAGDSMTIIMTIDPR